MSDFLAGLSQRLAATFNPGTAGEVLGDLLTGAVVFLSVFVVYYAAWRLLELLSRPILKRVRADETSVAFVQTALKYTVLAVGGIHALDAAGVNTAGILASLGVVGLTVGFAARDALSNVISGILIFWDRPFVIGDLVEIGGQYGRVDRITLRSTRVVTSDGRMLAVPNTQVINSTVASYTNFPTLRLDVPVTVGVGEDLDRARRLMLSLVENDPTFVPEPPPRIVVKSLNDYNVELEMQAWIHDEREHVRERFRLRERVFETLRSAGVDMPFQTFQLQPVELRSPEEDGARPL